MHRRAGSGILEVLVAALLGTIIVGLAVMLLQTQSVVARDATVRSERNDAMRSAFAILNAELRNIVPADVRAVARDSVVTRIFRGLGVVCGFNRPDVYIRYRGLRLPDPAKDSALQAGPDNVVAVAYVRADSSGCTRSPGDQLLAVRWTGEPRIGATWLIFESGGYHLSTHALRYRQGVASRQPITNEVLDDARSAFLPVADSVLRGIGISLHDRYVTSVVRGRLPLRNAR